MVEFKATLTLGEAGYPCDVEKLTPDAAYVRAADASAIPDGAMIDFVLEGYGPIPAEVVHMPDGALGLIFGYDTEERQVMADWLRGRGGSA